MSGYVDWIGAEADDSAPKDPLELGAPLAPADEPSLDEAAPEGATWQELPAHDFPVELNVPGDSGLEDVGWRMIRSIAILICGFTENVRWACCGATCAFR